MKKIISQQIIIDGKAYASIEEMPADLREQYGDIIAQTLADDNGNGIPDRLEQDKEIGEQPSLDDVKKLLTTQQIFSLGLNRGGWKTDGSRSTTDGETGLIKTVGRPARSSGGSTFGSTIRNMIVVAALFLLVFYMLAYGR